MTEKEALERFIRCTGRNDVDGALAALKSVSAETLNRQDGDGYDMLIQAAVSGNVCAMEALLKDGRCDLAHRENLCGMTAEDYALEFPEDCRVRQYFLMRKYTTAGAPLNFIRACEKNDVAAVKAHLMTGKHCSLNENFTYSMPPGFLQPLPLAAAVKAGAAACVRLLLEHGAAPDAFCRKYEKTPRELAAEKPAILKLFHE